MGCPSKSKDLVMLGQLTFLVAVILLTKLVDRNRATRSSTMLYNYSPQELVTPSALKRDFQFFEDIAQTTKRVKRETLSLIHI